MNNNINKEQLRKKFRKHLASYELQAVIQREIARELFSIFSGAKNVGECKRILEVGCGTGFLTREMFRECRPDAYFLNDLVEESVATALASVGGADCVVAVAGDAEETEFSGGLDAMVSASTVQWFSDFSAFSERASRLLGDDGVFVFNTFGTENLCQIKELTGRGLEYYTADELREILAQNFQDVKIREAFFNPVFGSPVEVLRHLQQTGVTATGEFRWHKSELMEFEQQYIKKYSEDNGVVLTWHVLYAVASKPIRL